MLAATTGQSDGSGGSGSASEWSGNEAAAAGEQEEEEDEQAGEEEEHEAGGLGEAQDGQQGGLREEEEEEMAGPGPGTSVGRGRGGAAGGRRRGRPAGRKGGASRAAAEREEEEEEGEGEGEGEEDDGETDGAAAPARRQKGKKAPPKRGPKSLVTQKPPTEEQVRAAPDVMCCKGGSGCAVLWGGAEDVEGGVGAGWGNGLGWHGGWRQGLCRTAVGGECMGSGRKPHRPWPKPYYPCPCRPCLMSIEAYKPGAACCAARVPISRSEGRLRLYNAAWTVKTARRFSLRQLTWTLCAAAVPPRTVKHTVHMEYGPVR